MCFTPTDGNVYLSRSFSPLSTNTDDGWSVEVVLCGEQIGREDIVDNILKRGSLLKETA